MALLCSAAALVDSAPAIAQRASDAEDLAVRLISRGTQVVAQFDVSNAFTERFRQRLTDGLKNRAVMAIELQDRAGSRIRAVERTCELRRDVWQEVVFVRIKDPAETRRERFLLVDEALRACGQAVVPVADRSLLRDEDGYRVWVRVSLNPVSPELMEKTREFMSNPRGTPSGQSRAFFGVLSRLFGSDDDVTTGSFLFRSGALARPALEVEP